MTQIYRQGDVLLYPIDMIPKGLSEDQSGIVAYGEMTGHNHRFTGKTVQVYKSDSPQTLSLASGEYKADTFVDVKGESEIVHQEHNTLTIPEGKYAVVIEQSFQPFLQEAQKTRD